MKKCTGMAMVGQQCPHKAIWRNQNGAEVCELHKLVLDAFTWENRGTRKWERINKEVDNEETKIRYSISLPPRCISRVCLRL